MTPPPPPRRGRGTISLSIEWLLIQGKPGHLSTRMAGGVISAACLLCNVSAVNQTGSVRSGQDHARSGLTPHGIYKQYGRTWDHCLHGYHTRIPSPGDSPLHQPPPPPTIVPQPQHTKVPHTSPYPSTAHQGPTPHHGLAMWSNPLIPIRHPGPPSTPAGASDTDHSATGHWWVSLPPPPHHPNTGTALAILPALVSLPALTPLPALAPWPGCPLNLVKQIRWFFPDSFIKTGCLSTIYWPCSKDCKVWHIKQGLINCSHQKGRYIIVSAIFYIMKKVEYFLIFPRMFL